MWFYFSFEKLLLSSPVNLKSCPKSHSIHQRGKNDTAIESLPLIRIPSLCNTFTSTTLSKMIRFWICKDQNDSLHTAQHAESLGRHVWSHFDWQFQSRRDQNPEFAFGVQSKHLFQYNSPKSKNGEPNFFVCFKGPFNAYKKIFFWIFKVGGRWFFWTFSDFQFWSAAPPGCAKKKNFFCSNSLLIHPKLKCTLAFFDSSNLRGSRVVVTYRLKYQWSGAFS